MINGKELIEYRKKADNFLKGYSDLSFNHYGFQAKDSKDYNKIVTTFGKVWSEVNFQGRRITTLRTQFGIVEVLEPKPDQSFTFSAVDHVSYVTNNLDEFKKNYPKEIISSFNVGNTHGIKISPEKDLIIEIRNNDILDSVKDFK